MSKKADTTKKPLQPAWVACQQQLAGELHALRLGRRIKQADLARMAGVSRSTLSSLEHEGRATLETLLRVMWALGAQGQIEHMIAALAEARAAAGVTLDDILADEARKAQPAVRQRVRGRKP